MRSNFNKGIVEGALLLAIWLVLAVVTAFTPLALAIGFLLPLPFVVLTVRQDIGVAILASVLAFIAPLLVGIDLARTVGMAVISIVPGIALGVGYKRGMKPTLTFAFGLGGYIVAAFLLMNILSLVFGLNLVVEALDLLQRITISTVDLLQRLDFLPSGALENLLEGWVDLEASAVFLLPGLLLVVATSVTFVVQNISQLILNRLGEKVEPFPPFVKWRFGDWYLWLFVFSLILRWVPIHPVLLLIGFSTFSPMFYGLAIQGMAVVYWWLRKVPWKPLRVAPLLLVLYPFAFVIFSLIGIADFIVNFRRL